MMDASPRRSWPGRLIGTVAGVAVLAVLLHLVSGSAVLSALHRAAVWLPLVFAIEGGMLACDTWALWLLYQEDRHHLSAGDMVRAALGGYPPMVLLPAGRAMAEVLRAGILARRTSAHRAAAAAVLMQAVLLLATGVISTLCAGVTLIVLGPSTLPAVMAGNALVTGALGSAILLGGRRSRIGAWLARRWERIRSGPEFDALLIKSPFPLQPLLIAIATRLLQATELTVLVVAVGGHADLFRAFVAEGAHLIGASAGDLIPAQLGVSEAVYTLSATLLGLVPGGALAVALLAHVTQAVWALIGSASQLVLGAGAAGPAQPAPETQP